ncbi:ankyrin repeat-containing domain protein [Lactarius hengduanensis]|nr:ankyrin repeat-containing domain protein [Lactarius hengduanensis]
MHMNRTGLSAGADDGDWLARESAQGNIPLPILPVSYLTAHPLAAQLQACDSPAAILTILQDQVDRFNQSRSSNQRLQKWLNRTINVLYAVSVTLGEGIGLAFSPANVIFAGVGAVLLAAKDVYASQDLLVDIFERIENLFRRLEIYTKVTPTPAMTDVIANIMVEVLDIPVIATKEMKQSRANLENVLKKVAGVTNLEDGIKKLDKPTNEEARMANVVVLKLVERNVQVVGAQVCEADENILGVGAKVKDVNGEPLTPALTVSSLDGKAIAEEVRLDTQRTADDIDDMKPYGGHLEIVRMLLAHNINTNAASNGNCIPLHLALEEKHLEIIQLLIEHGSWGVNARDRSGSMPLHLALSLGSTKAVEVFIRRGADVNARDGGHQTPLQLSLSSGCTETTWLLVQHGPDVDAPSQGHSTPLHLTFTKGSTEMVQLLVRHGADVNAKDESHQTVLHLASSERCLEIVQLLIQSGADVNAQGESRKTPLHLALSTRVSAETA